MLATDSIALLPAVFFLMGALLARRGWAVTLTMTSLALVSALVGPLAILALNGPGQSASSLFPLSSLLGALVAFIGWVVTVFSRRNLAGDRAESSLRIWLPLCLAAASLVVAVQDWRAFFAAWVVISLSLNRLMLCYPERHWARMAGRKQWLYDRVSDLALGTAIALLWWQHGTFAMAPMMAALEAGISPGVAEQTAAVLLVMAALLRCAQMPFHGWLPNVAEAPAPVSALLHAGVVNLGGVLMLWSGPLILASPAARWLLLSVATITLLLASWKLLLENRYKVQLAWSTLAHMALMLIECALGLFELAVLHLITHSLYKAHAFLSSGEAVNLYLSERLTPRGELTLWRWLRNLAISVALVAVSATLAGIDTGPGHLAMAWLASAAFALWLPTRDSLKQWLFSLFSASALLALYWLQKEALVPLVPWAGSATGGQALWVVLITTVMATGCWHIQQAQCRGRSTWRLWLFYRWPVDEWLSRLIRRCWPAERTRTARTPSLPSMSFTENPHGRIARDS